MRSGISHLTKRKVNEAAPQISGDWHELNSLSLTDNNAEIALPADCALDHPVWAVVSFDKVEAGGLRYYQAAELIRELEAHGISGLCIITDDAALRGR